MSYRLCLRPPLGFSAPPMSMSFTWDEGFDILELAGHLHPYDLWLENPACWERQRLKHLCLHLVGSSCLCSCSSLQSPTAPTCWADIYLSSSSVHTKLCCSTWHLSSDCIPQILIFYESRDYMSVCLFFFKRLCRGNCHHQKQQRDLEPDS